MTHVPETTLRLLTIHADGGLPSTRVFVTPADGAPEVEISHLVRRVDYRHEAGDVPVIVLEIIAVADDARPEHTLTATGRIVVAEIHHAMSRPWVPDGPPGKSGPSSM